MTDESTDEATKLLRETREYAESKHPASEIPMTCGELLDLLNAQRAAVEALPAAAPPSATNWPQLPTMADYAAALPAPLPGPPREPPTCPHCGSLLSVVTWTCVRGRYCPGAGIPREPTVDMSTAADCVEWLRHMADDAEPDDRDKLHICANIIVEYYAPTLEAHLTRIAGEGDCVIAPNQTGVQGQSTMQAGGVTCDQTERLADLDAKSFSRANANTNEREP